MVIDYSLGAEAAGFPRHLARYGTTLRSSIMRGIDFMSYYLLKKVAI
jgi:hypothetical protein